MRIQVTKNIMSNEEHENSFRKIDLIRYEENAKKNIISYNKIYNVDILTLCDRAGLTRNRNAVKRRF